MLKLFYDSETTGLPLFKEPSEHPGQPHLVQLAACLVHSETRKVHASIDLIVRPNGWEIPDDVAALHGITTERAMDEGVPEEMAVELLLDLWQEGKRTRIAHNEPFDARIIRIALKRHVDPFNADAEVPVSDLWKQGATECTQQLSTPILQLPPTEKMKKANFNKFKSANLREAYKHFTGRDLVDAHSAMPDVQACMAVYFGVMDLRREPVAA